MSGALREHLGYVADPVRLEQYKTAIAQTIECGDRVVDLGCGTGILGLLCLRAGAVQIFAIDSTAMIEVARASLTRAGFGDRVRFFHGQSTQIDLPERVDAAICDQVGFFGFDAGIVEYFEDARRRFLKPGGKLIPAAIAMQLAAVESEACHALAEGWRVAGIPEEFRWLHEYAVNTKYPVKLQRAELLSEPDELGVIDLRVPNPDFFSWTAELRMRRNGVMHGLGGWFECELTEGVGMTNSPLSDRPIRREQAFLPIGEAVHLKSGDTVKAMVMTRPADNLLAWEVEIPSSGQKFSHSTWKGELLSASEIARRDPAHVPQLNRIGRARQVVTGYCDGRRTFREIEEAVLREHPDLFPSAQEISRFVAQILGRDSA